MCSEVCRARALRRYEDCPVQPHLRIFVGSSIALKLIGEAQRLAEEEPAPASADSLALRRTLSTLSEDGNARD